MMYSPLLPACNAMVMYFELVGFRRHEWCRLGTLEENGFLRDTCPDFDLS